MSEPPPTSRVHVHATFTVSEPLPLFLLAVEVLEGPVQAGMHVRIPLNLQLWVLERIESVAPVENDWGLDLIGLLIRCESDDARDFIDSLRIGDEVLIVEHEPQPTSSPNLSPDC